MHIAFLAGSGEVEERNEEKAESRCQRARLCSTREQIFQFGSIEAEKH